MVGTVWAVARLSCSQAVRSKLLFVVIGGCATSIVATPHLLFFEFASRRHIVVELIQADLRLAALGCALIMGLHWIHRDWDGGGVASLFARGGIPLRWVVGRFLGAGVMLTLILSVLSVIAAVVLKGQGPLFELFAGAVAEGCVMIAMAIGCAALLPRAVSWVALVGLWLAGHTAKWWLSPDGWGPAWAWLPDLNALGLPLGPLHSGQWPPLEAGLLLTLAWVLLGSACFEYRELRTQG